MRDIELEKELEEVIEKHIKNAEEQLDILSYANIELGIPDDMIISQVNFWIESIV